MVKQQRLGIRQVEALNPGEIAWDPSLRGFGARRQRSDAVTYILAYRTKGRQRWFTIGRHGAPWTPDMARKEAVRLLGEVAKGRDPAADKQAERNAKTVAELLDAYLAAAEAGRLMTKRGGVKKPSTMTTDRSRIDCHIRPRLGALGVAAVTTRDVEKFMHDVAAPDAAGKARTGAAARSVGLLGAIFSYAVKHGMRADNPVRGVTKFRDGRRERRLTDDEYIALGAGLREAEAASMWPPAVQAARFLALTGWRRGEALQLRWAEVDLARRTATLVDTKTGRSVRPLSHVACDLLRGILRTGDLVFPATRGDGPMRGGFAGFWAGIARLGGLPSDITPHVLRHSFASLAGDLGYSDATIAALVGHVRGGVTSRYIHAADAVLLKAADEVAGKTAALMGDNQVTSQVVDFPRVAS